MARIEGRPEPLGDPLPGDDLRAPSRHEQLGGQNRSRHHHRMIEAGGTLWCASAPDGDVQRGLGLGVVTLQADVRGSRALTGVRRGQGLNPMSCRETRQPR
jgi:hypothetical protein